MQSKIIGITLKHLSYSQLRWYKFCPRASHATYLRHPYNTSCVLWIYSTNYSSDTQVSCTCTAVSLVWGWCEQVALVVVGKRCVPKISSTQDGTIGLHEATYSRVQNLLFLSFLHSILLYVSGYEGFSLGFRVFFYFPTNHSARNTKETIVW